MLSKKTFFTAVSLAVFASLLTALASSQFKFFNKYRFIPELGGMGSNTLEKVSPEMYPAEDGEMRIMDEAVGETSMAMVDSDAIEPGLMAPVSQKILPPYYGDDALDVEDRVYQNSSYHSVVVNDVSDYLRGIKEYVMSIDGRILSSDVSTTGKYDSGSLYMKVPVDKFNETTTRITEGVDKVVSESINSQDVTGELVNNTENIQSLKDQKSLKQAALADAKTEVEKRRYQIEIERLDRQISAAEKGLDRVEQKVEYSTVSVSAASSARYFSSDADLSLGEEFARAWASLKSVLRVALYFGVWVAVYSVIFVPIVLAFNKITKRK